MDEIIFLTLDEVSQIHAQQLALYGGAEGFVNRNVVESAAAQPSARMFGKYLHADIAEMAAAYLFHFAAAQGFADGNKRTGAASAAVFLARNGYRLDCPPMELYETTMRVANHEIGKEQVADWIAQRLAPVA